jgi:hypothetical protein
MIAHASEIAVQGRFTRAGIDADRAIARDLDVVRTAVVRAMGDRLRALVLVGGYGRGEGGAVHRARGWSAHNDYDLVVVVRGEARGLRASLEHLGASLAFQIGTPVDLWPVSERSLADAPKTLWWLDVALGGARVLEGPTSVLDPIRALTARSISLDEAGRLLANRAVGLALSRLGGDASSERVATRHAHKCALACGDALLLACDRYEATREARSVALASLESSPRVGPELVRAYAESVAFHSRPDRWSPADESWFTWFERTRALAADRHLAFESWRVRAPRDPVAFAQWDGALYPDAQELRGARGALSIARAARRWGLSRWTPRERLARAAVLLAYGPRGDWAAADALLALGHSPTDDQRRSALEQLVKVAG